MEENMKRLAMLLLVSVVSCSEDKPAESTDAATDTRTTSDTAPTDMGVDCSKVGCAPPPPCGEMCKEVCGCCPNPACTDSGTTDAADGG
jgi:hypothetical protein